MSRSPDSDLAVLTSPFTISMCAAYFGQRQRPCGVVGHFGEQDSFLFPGLRLF